MSENPRKVYEEMLSVFAMPGWKHIAEEMEQAIKDLNYNGLRRCKNEYDLGLAHGELRKLEQFSLLEDQIRRAVDDIDQGDSDESAA